MVHLEWHVQVTWLLGVTCLVQLLSVRVRNERVLLAMNNQHGTASSLDSIIVAETLVHHEPKEGGPAQNALGCVLNARIGTHKD